jgi:uncharacterized protein (DUF2237 family)
MERGDGEGKLGPIDAGSHKFCRRWTAEILEDGK